MFLTRGGSLRLRCCFRYCFAFVFLASFPRDVTSSSTAPSFLPTVAAALISPALPRRQNRVESVSDKKATPLSANCLRLSSSHHEKDDVEVSRRDFGQKNIFRIFTVAAFSCGMTSPEQQLIALAAEEGKTRRSDNNKPYAPLENLLPATRVKVLIDNSVNTAQDIVNAQKEGKSTTASIAQLEQYLLNTDSFMTPAEVEASKRYLQIKTLSSWTAKRQEETRKKFEIDNVSPLTRTNEAFEQWGERRQFRRLRRQQQAMESDNNMRAALNSYTNNLVFGESYKLNAGKDERRRLIRTYDQLPDVTSVVRSDLDLRDLYRNQILTKIDDARAEFKYQLGKLSFDDKGGGSSSADEFDATELLLLLKEVQAACKEWFDFIPEEDQREALDSVLREQKGAD